MHYVEAYSHGDGQIGVLVEFECSDEYALRTDEFREFAKDTAMHVAAFKPLVVSPNELAEVILLRESVNYEENKLSQALLEQPYIKDQSFIFKEKLNNLEQQLGVKIVIRRFKRYGK